MTSTSAFRKITLRQRFESILRFLHFVDNKSALPQAEDRNRLFKIRPVIEELVRQLQQNYTLVREISIYETMVKFKERKFFRQFLPSPSSMVLNCLPCQNPNLVTSGIFMFTQAAKGGRAASHKECCCSPYKPSSG